MQRAYIDTLFALAEKDARVISLVADNGTDYDWLFQRDFPDQFYNVGIAEQNMVAMAAGLADMGLIPFVSTAGAFLIYRAYEFIRNDVCIGHKNVKLIATGSGLSISNLGPTHHTTEDIALLRTLPGLTVFSPTTPDEVRIAVREAYAIQGPVYIRIGMTGESNALSVSSDLYRANCLIEGTETAICVSGSIAEIAVQAANALHSQGISTAVYSFPCLSALDWRMIDTLAETTRLIVTAEDHRQDSGLGSLIAQRLSEKARHAPLLTIGTERFAEGFGSQQEVRQKNGLSADAIVEKICRRWEELG